MSIQRSMRRHIKRQAKEAKPEKPIGRMGKAVNWAFAKLPEPVRRRIVLAKYQFTKPAPHPSQIGKPDDGRYRPVQIELGFLLFPDGRVLYRNRWGGDLKVTNPDVIQMVHHEYSSLVAEAKRQGGLH